MIAHFTVCRLLALAGLAATLATPASAHRRWLLPSITVMAGDKGLASVDAAASNALFAFDHRALGLDTLAITGPDGKPVSPVVIGKGEMRSAFDVPLAQPGTYRIALAMNGMMGSYVLNGEKKRWRGSRARLSEIPAGAANLELSENLGRVETFVTLGAPSTTALAATGQGLEMLPVTHPNDIVAGEPAEMRFVMDGKPAAGLKVEFVAGGTRHRDQAGIQTLTTNADGIVRLMAATPGFYYLEADMEGGTAAAPAPGQPAVKRRASYTAVLEFLPQ